jgi:hypothetical protein
VKAAAQSRARQWNCGGGEGVRTVPPSRPPASRESLDAAEEHGAASHRDGDQPQTSSEWKNCFSISFAARWTYDLSSRSPGSPSDVASYAHMSTTHRIHCPSCINPNPWSILSSVVCSEAFERTSVRSSGAGQPGQCATHPVSDVVVHGELASKVVVDKARKPAKHSQEGQSWSSALTRSSRRTQSGP